MPYNVRHSEFYREARVDTTLLDIKNGENAEVVAIEGGHMLGMRLEALGIRPGKQITRISNQWLGGPVTVAVDGRQTACGRRTAAKIKVRPRI